MRAGGRQVIPRPDNFQVINQVPWHNLDTSALNSLEVVCSAVRAFQPDQSLRQPFENARPSAVLVGLFESSSGVEVILTRRSQELTNHRGEISFPGGRLDRNETVIDAALRETYEEIGIEPSTAKVVGELNSMSTVTSNSHIVPIVASFQTVPSFRAANREVDRVFSVPLCELVREDTYSQEHWVFSDREFQVNLFHLDDETIWGATARVLFQIIMLTVEYK